MTSKIDPTKPSGPVAYTADVRSNFAAAASEISALQQEEAGGPFLPLAGGTVTGNVTIDGTLTLQTSPIIAAIPGSFSNDSQAAAGGVAIGELYRQGSALQIRVT